MIGLDDLAVQIRKLPERYSDPEQLALRAARMVQAFALGQVHQPTSTASLEDDTADHRGEEPLKHTCNTSQPGRPLPFGKRAAPGVCARCDQLRGGADPIPGWNGSAQQDGPSSAAIEAHFASDRHRRECQPVCTFGDW